MTAVNISKLCGLHDSTVLVPVYEWVTFLELCFKKNSRNKCVPSFLFFKVSPMCGFLIDSLEIEFQILKSLEIKLPNQLPPEIVPLGLSEEQKRYFHREIREFCRPGTGHLVAPEP